MAVRRRERPTFGGCRPFATVAIRGEDSACRSEKRAWRAAAMPRPRRGRDAEREQSGSALLGGDCRASLEAGCDNRFGCRSTSTAAQTATSSRSSRRCRTTRSPPARSAARRSSGSSTPSPSTSRARASTRPTTRARPAPSHPADGGSESDGVEGRQGLKGLEGRTTKPAATSSSKKDELGPRLARRGAGGLVRRVAAEELLHRPHALVLGDDQVAGGGRPGRLQHVGAR